MSPLVPAQIRSGATARRAAGTDQDGRAAGAAADATLRNLLVEITGNSTGLAHWVCAPHGLVSASPSAALLLGLAPTSDSPASDSPASDLSEAAGPAPSGPLAAAVTTALAPVLVAAAAGAPWDEYDAENDVACADGVLRRVRLRARSVPDHAGWTVGTIEPIGTPVADVESRYRLLLELSPDALIVHDAGVIVYANPAAVAFARGRSIADLIGKPILSFVAPQSQMELLQRLAGLNEPGAVSAPSEAVMLRLDGTTMVMEATSVRTSWNGKVAFQVIMRDLSERRAAEAAIRQQASLVEHVSDAIVAVDESGAVTNWNPAATSIFGWSAVAAVGCTLAELFGADVVQDFGVGTRLETRLPRYDGEVIDVELAIDVVLGPGGVPSGSVMICSDITERRHIETERRVTQARLLHQSRHDNLTGLANRAMVLEHLEALLADDRFGGGADVAVLFLDLDRFKLINDSLGHAAGDEVLRIVSRRLASAVRSEDLVGRLAGDEFVVLVADAQVIADLDRLVDRLFATLTEPLMVNGRPLTVTASIGIAVVDRAERADAEDLLRDADVAMYTAKQGGRSRAVRFDAQLRSQALHSLELEEDLRRAIDNDDISVAYQPLVELATGTVAATEALARWTHPRRGPMSPGLFIPVAEETGMIGRLGMSVLADACRRTAAWRGAGFPGLRASVNLSGQQLADTNLVPEVVATLERNALPASALSLEITESVLMTDPDAAARTLQALAEVGVGLSVDDFGTGYSSLSYLRQFPVDTIKIDRSFVADITHDTADLAIVDSVIGLAHRLNLRTVAEGAETREQVDVLRELGCHQIQGFYFSRPLTPEKVPDFVRERYAGSVLDLMEQSSDQIRPGPTDSS